MVLLSLSSSSSQGAGSEPPFPEEDEELKPETLRMLLHSIGGAEETMGSLCKPGVFMQETTCASPLSIWKTHERENIQTTMDLYWP